MGLYDTLLVLDDVADLRCPDGHDLRSFQTKDLDEPSMCTYLVSGGRLYLAVRRDAWSGAERDEARWRIEGKQAFFEQRFELQELPGPRHVSAYGQCSACDPVLVRTDHPGLFGDLVSEHAIFVDFALTLRVGEPLGVERTSGTRDELKAELSRRGVYVLKKDEALAVAHREIKAARQRLESCRSRSRR